MHTNNTAKGYNKDSCFIIVQFEGLKDDSTL